MSRWSARRWLVAFRAAGGAVWFGNDQLWFGWPTSVSDQQHYELQRLSRLIESDTRHLALTLQAGLTG